MLLLLLRRRRKQREAKITDKRTPEIEQFQTYPAGSEPVLIGRRGRDSVAPIYESGAELDENEPQSSRIAVSVLLQIFQA